MEVVIAAVARTPIGKFNGSLAALSAPQLGSAAIRAAVSRAKLSPSSVEQCWMGNVISADVGQAPARQAALGAGLDEATCCTTVNKVCSSGLKAIILGAQQIMLGDAAVVVAGGMESMSNAPYYLPKARWGLRMGHTAVNDALIKDGLWDPYGECLMGTYAELCADTLKISREEQDRHAEMSYDRSVEAIKTNCFEDEIVPVALPKGREGSSEVASDEEPFQRKGAASNARPAFKKPDGTVTAFNASSISDGAAAVVLMSREAAERLSAPILATIRGYADAEQAPSLFPTAPALAIPKAVAAGGIRMNDVDFFEINEAFSVVACANANLLGLDPARVNVFGGAVSLGHPIGASGARIVVTLLSVLKRKGGRYGVAGICNGGGGASALLIEAA
ncbi:hypothetical protein AB1Y20_003737 [Prymnesium parvum]|uniref:acetyl-CoA C-acetyltransferase n=1 Tax=Prymnesium parvum TaxID=97485 RepID=A0AB34J744_PRYPA